MITAIIGEGGKGKTSLLTYLLKQDYITQGKQRMRSCIAQITAFNKNRATPLTLPDKPPYYTNFDVTIPTGYRRSFEPYFLNPYYFGIPNIDKEVQAIMPHAAIFLNETDKIYDSREKCLPEAVSALYNKQRHFWLDIYIELHRGMNADTLVRSNVHKFIEIQSQEREKDNAGNVVKIIWHCREFEGAKDYLAYLNNFGKEKNYTSTVYTAYENIFRFYNSRECSKDFIPKEGADFSTLAQPSKINISAIPAAIAKFYQNGEPKGWRKKD